MRAFLLALLGCTILQVQADPPLQTEAAASLPVAEPNAVPVVEPVAVIEPALLPGQGPVIESVAPAETVEIPQESLQAHTLKDTLSPQASDSSRGTAFDTTPVIIAPSASAPPPVPGFKRMLNVAVLPFAGSRTLSTEDLSAITSRFETELMGQGTFRVLERRNVDAILREQGFQGSGACNTSDCQVQVGQMLGVERIVTGEVTRLEKLWSLNLRMIDVGSGAVVASHVLDIKGRLETVLRGGCPEMAEILAGKKQPGNSRTVLAEESKGISPWVWVASGTVVVSGGIVAALLLSQDDGSSTTASAPPRDITVTLETGR